MGEPYFQIRQRFTEQECIALSVNFALYADMSSRLMGEAAALGDRQEVYSAKLSAPGYCCVSFEKEVVDWCCD